MARREGKISELPKKASKKPRKIEERTVLVIRDGERAAIRKRPSKGLLAGLYELPNLSGSLDADQVLETLKTWGMNALRIQKPVSYTHLLTARMFGSYDCVDIVLALDAVVKAGEQTVCIRRQIHADNICFLVGDVIQESGILMSKSIVVLLPYVGCQDEVQRSNRLSPGTVSYTHLLPSSLQISFTMSMFFISLWPPTL